MQGPFGDEVGDGVGEVQGGKGVEAFDVATLPDAGDPVSVKGTVSLVDLVHYVLTECFLGLSHAAGGFDVGDGRVEVGAGDPEARGHLAGRFVLYDAR